MGKNSSLEQFAEELLNESVSIFWRGIFGPERGYMSINVDHADVPKALHRVYTLAERYGMSVWDEGEGPFRQYLEFTQITLFLTPELSHILKMGIVKAAEPVALVVEGISTKCYVQCKLKGQHTLITEAVSSAFLGGDQRLSAQQEQALVSLGWSAPDGKDYPNFYKLWDTQWGEWLEAADLMHTSFTDVYQEQKGLRLEWIKL